MLTSHCKILDALKDVSTLLVDREGEGEGLERPCSDAEWREAVECLRESSDEIDERIGSLRKTNKTGSDEKVSQGGGTMESEGWG